MLIYRPPETKGFTKKFTGTLSAAAAKCHNSFSWEVSPHTSMKFSLSSWLFSSCGPAPGAELTLVHAAVRRALCAWCCLDRRSTLVPQQPNNCKPAGPKKCLQQGHRNNFSAFLDLSTFICPETQGALKSSTTPVPAASPALQPSPAPRKQPGWSCRFQTSGEFGRRWGQ